MIPQSFIQDLLARVDIVEVVGRHVQLKKGGQNYLGLCPFHAENTPSFTVSPTKQFYHCFGCGQHGSAIGFVMEHRGLNYVETIRDLAQSAGLQVPEESPQAAVVQGRARALTEVLARAAEFYRGALKDSAVAIDYLKSRGVTGKTASRFGLGYSPDAWQPLRAAFDDYDDARLVEAGVVIAEAGKRYDRFRGRVMFPIRNLRGQVIGFGARALAGAEPKYLNSPETPIFRKGQELYGLHEARDAIRRAERAVVVEGYLDVIQLAQAGFEDAVAALGTAITPAHVSTLFRITDHVVFAFDGDAAGRKAAHRALEAALPVLADTKRASFLLLPEGEDPDSLIRNHGSAAFERLLDQALPLSRFLVRTVAADGAPQTAEDRAAMVSAAKPLLLSMAPGALRMQLLQELANAAQVSADELHGLFGLKRFAGRPAPLARRTRHAEVGDLKRSILQQLLVQPLLAFEYGAAIEAEHGERGERLDDEIVEIWQAATSLAPQAAATINHGTLLELLGDSPNVGDYRALAAQEMELDTDIDTAREILQQAFGKLRLRRLAQARAQRLAEYEQQPSEDRLASYREADRAYLSARRPPDAAVP